LVQGLPVERDFEANSLRIVAVGSQIALYVNGAPTLYVNDPGYTECFKAGRTKLLVCHKGVTPGAIRQPQDLGHLGSAVAYIYSISQKSALDKVRRTSEVRCTCKNLYPQICGFDHLRWLTSQVTIH
jgi:hypothetical protein